MASLPAAVAASTCAAWNWPGLQVATTSTSGSSSLEQGLYAGGRPRPGPAGHQGAHFVIHNMHDDLQPVAKGREGGKMNGLGDGTRYD
jgi:hypothetical protein